ncbi:hypothetical protein Tco_1333016 [Tanacetum coccineum]
MNDNVSFESFSMIVPVIHEVIPQISFRCYISKNGGVTVSSTTSMRMYEKEVNEIRAEKIARNANPLALVVAAQQYPDTYYQAPKPHRPYAPPAKTSPSTRSHATTRRKGKEIVKPITPPSESAFEEDNTSPKYKNDNQNGQFGNQRTVTVAGARETVGSQECRKPKWAKDYTYHKEKMLLCKQAGKGVSLQAEQADWREDMDEEIDEQELEAHYSFMAKIQEVLPAESGYDAEPLEKIQKQLKKANTSLSHELQECKSALEECKSSLDKSNRTRYRYLGALHDKEVEKYKIFKDHTIKKDTLKRKLNETLGLLAQKEHDIQEGLKIKAYEVSVVKEKNDELVKNSLLTKSSYEGVVKEKNKSIQTIRMLAPKGSTYNGRPTFANHMYLKKAQSEKPCLYEIPYDKCDLANLFGPDREETSTLEQESRSKLNTDLVKPYDYTKQNSIYENFKPPSREYLDQLAHANKV